MFDRETAERAIRHRDCHREWMAINVGVIDIDCVDPQGPGAASAWQPKQRAQHRIRCCFLWCQALKCGQVATWSERVKKRDGDCGIGRSTAETAPNADFDSMEDDRIGSLA